MFHSLERSIKKEIAAVRTDMSHILARVEETEQRQETNEHAITELQDTVKQLALAHRANLYKLEDLENRSRRNNLRIRGLPEATRDSDLEATIRGVLNMILGRAATESLRFDRIHRALRPRNLAVELPRDVICRLHYFEDKNAVMIKLRNMQDIDFDGAKLHIFPDLSKATLDRRRVLKPLLERLQSEGITYRWGFPACLIATKSGRSSTLRFPEDLPIFLQELNIQHFELPGWQDPIPIFKYTLAAQWKKTPSKKKVATTPSSSKKNG